LIAPISRRPLMRLLQTNISRSSLVSNFRVIYPNDDGGVSVIVPAAECGLTIEEIAAKDVPQDKPYKIVDVADIPTDRTFRNAWEYSND
jgi:hypothetical protein